MAMTPREVEEKEFKVGFRGYSVKEVDDYLDTVAEEIDRLIKENEELSGKVDAYAANEDRVKELELTLRDTLITAQRAAEDVIQSSRDRAEVIVNDAEKQSVKLISDAQMQVQTARSQFDSINRDIAGVKALIRKVIDDQLKLLEEAYPDGREAPAPNAAELPKLQFNFDQTQEFSAREVREAAGGEERSNFQHKRFEE